jgi:alcohol dehydrogenase
MTDIPLLMHAIEYRQYGHPDDVLDMYLTSIPDIGSNEVLVKVYSAALNPVDYKIVQGFMKMFSFLLKKKPGFDFSGKIVGVGCNVTKFKVNDYVHGMTCLGKTGTFAEYLTINESNIARIPENMSLQEAAAIPLVSLTSLYISKYISQSSNVLILGGRTATGMAAIQIAKSFNANYIVTTCSKESTQLVQSLGADVCIDYKNQDVWYVLRNNKTKFDVIYDTIGGSFSASGSYVWDGATSVLADSGQLITITGDTQGNMDIPELIKRGWQIFTRNSYLRLNHGGAAYHQHGIFGGDGKKLKIINSLGIRAILNKRQYDFTLPDVKNAFKKQMSGNAKGKIIINVFEE